MTQQLLVPENVQETMMSEESSRSWEDDIAQLLHELASTQDELLQVLVQKRDFMARADVRGMESLQPRELQLHERLQS